MTPVVRTSIRGKIKRIAMVMASAVPLVIAGAGSANAAGLLANGDFTGAQWASWIPAIGGTTVATPFNFTSHTYLQNFAWSDTGCDCLDWVARNGSQVIGNAPANPAGYNGDVYVADASTSYDTGTYLAQTINGLTVGDAYKVTFQQAGGGYYTGLSGLSAQWSVGWGGSLGYGASGWTLSNAVSQSSPVMDIGSATGTAPWETESLTFKATSASELLTFFATGSGSPPFALLANVSVAAVPEPSSWAMIILGVGMIGFVMRRQRLAAAHVA